MNPKILFWFNGVAGLCSIVSVLIAIFGERIGAYIALGSFVLFLISIVAILWYWIYGVIHQEYPDDYVRLSVFSSYETSDGVNGVYERYRTIQVKRLALSSIDFQFKWTGSKAPEISSDLQRVVGEPVSGGKDYDRIKLAFKDILLYNETAIIHFRAKVEDLDQKAIPMDCYKVETPTPLIHYRITLKNKPDGYNVPAKLQKCLINSSIRVDFEDIKSIPFDPLTKSYQCDLINPEIGYYYRILWER